jgi:hypothetical protein
MMAGRKPGHRMKSNRHTGESRYPSFNEQVA